MSLIGPQAVAGRVLWIRVCLSILLTFHPSVQKFSCDWLKLGKVLETHVLCVTELEFFKKICPKNEENVPKIGIFGVIGKFSHYFFLNLVYKESSYYLLFCCTNPILGKNLVPETWVKMLSANQIAEFWNWLYVQNYCWKSLNFCMLIQGNGN